MHRTLLKQGSLCVALQWEHQDLSKALRQHLMASRDPNFPLNQRALAQPKAHAYLLPHTKRTQKGNMESPS